MAFSCARPGLTCVTNSYPRLTPWASLFSPLRGWGATIALICTVSHDTATQRVSIGLSVVPALNSLLGAVHISVTTCHTFGDLTPMLRCDARHRPIVHSLTSLSLRDVLPHVPEIHCGLADGDGERDLRFPAGVQSIACKIANPRKARAWERSRRTPVLPWAFAVHS